MGESASFSLNSEGGESAAPKPGRRTGYDQPYSFYTSIYQVAERTIKHWVGVGRDRPEPDLPPLDKPAAMAAWYGRCKSNRVPDRLIALAAKKPPLPKSSPATAPSAAAATAGLPPLSATHSPPLPPAAQAPARGYTATLERLREAEAVAGAKYTTALLTEDKEAEAEQARRSWQNIVKELRAYEKDAEEIMQKNGQSWSAVDVIAAMHEVHVPLRDGMLSLYGRLENRLAALPREQRLRLFREEVKRLFSALISNKFTAPPPDQATAA